VSAFPYGVAVVVVAKFCQFCLEPRLGLPQRLSGTLLESSTFATGDPRFLPLRKLRSDAFDSSRIAPEVYRPQPPAKAKSQFPIRHRASQTLIGDQVSLAP
jgi:hypothetical protein